MYKETHLPTIISQRVNKYQMVTVQKDLHLTGQGEQTMVETIEDISHQKTDENEMQTRQITNKQGQKRNQ